MKGMHGASHGIMMKKQRLPLMSFPITVVTVQSDILHPLCRMREELVFFADSTLVLARHDPKVHIQLYRHAAQIHRASNLNTTPMFRNRLRATTKKLASSVSVQQSLWWWYSHGTSESRTLPFVTVQEVIRGVLARSAR